MGGLQMAFDIHGRMGECSPSNITELAIVQIVVQKDAQADMARKILDGIGMESERNCPIRVVTDAEPVPPGYVQITDIVIIL